MTEEGSIFGLSPKASGSEKTQGKQPKRKPRKKAEEPRSDQPVTAERELEALAAEGGSEDAAQAPEEEKAKKPARKPRKAAPKKAQDDEAEEKAEPEAGGEEAKKPAPKRKRPPRKRAAKPKAAKDEAVAEEQAESQGEEATEQSVEEKPKPKRKPRPRRKPKAESAPEAQGEPEQKPAPEKEPAPETEAPSATVEFAEATPDEVIAPEDELPEMTFDALPQHLKDACGRAGWDKLMPVQALSMPYLMQGRDLMIQSRTGSGKTGSFTLPILDRVDLSRDECQALVLVPTRELAQQVANEAELLAGDTGLRVAAVYGGTGYGPQLEALKQGAHLVVGTPGRVLDHLLRRSFTLDGIEVLVFDEADRMLSIGFYPDMREVQRYLPKRKVSMFMTSATYPPHVMRLAGEFMENPQLLSLSHKRVHVAETPHLYFECKPMEKDRALVRVIEMENPASAFIFCNTKQNVHYVTAVLQRFGYDADELSGDLTQNKREQVLSRIRRGELRFLVATDVAARGIDIPDLSHVFLYEPPEDHEVYIHRAGRTGRAGASGEVISLVDVMEKLALTRISKLYKITLEARKLPTDDDVQAAVAQRMTALLESRLRTLDNVQRERIARFKHLAKNLTEADEGLDLMAMLLDETYQAQLQTAPPKPPSKDKGPRQSKPSNGRKPRPRNRQQAKPEQEAQRSEEPNGNVGDDLEPKPKRRRRRRRRKKPASSNGNE